MVRYHTYKDGIKKGRALCRRARARPAHISSETADTTDEPKAARKIKESLSSVLPVTGLVVLIHLLLCPLPAGTFWLFLIGAAMLVLGMGLFTLGADIAMMPMGERVGAHLTKSKSCPSSCRCASSSAC